MKNNNKSILIIFLSALIPLASRFLFADKSLIGDNISYLILWAICNYLFLSVVMDLSSNYRRVFKLENLNLNKTTMYVNLFIYISFLIFINFFFFNQLFKTDISILKYIASIRVSVFLFLTFLVNIMCGTFPKKTEKENANIYSISDKNSFKYGRELWGIVVGNYESGIVTGSYYFPYEDIKTIYTDKNKDLVIKGKKEDEQFRINVNSEKSKSTLIELIKKDLSLGKIPKNTTVNI